MAGGGARRAGGGRSVAWLWLAALALIGVGVVFARETQRGRALVDAPPAATTTVAPPAAAVRPVATPSLAPTAAPTLRPAARPATNPTRATTSTATRGQPTPSAAQRAPATPPTGAPTVAPNGTASNAAGPPAGAATAAGGTNAGAGVATAVGASNSGPGAATAAGGTGSGAAAEPGSAMVALTFDAGADRGYAPDILDILAEQHVPASFGLTGQWAAANADLVRRMAADGHFVFNHTLDHRSFTGLSDKLGGLSAARRRAELEDADAILAPLLGHTTRPFYRLPYGDDDLRVTADVQPAGYTRKVGWTVDSLGWRGASAPDIVARCLGQGAPGAVYVFHVGRASQDAIALPQVIRGLRERGFAFRRVDRD